MCRCGGGFDTCILGEGEENDEEVDSITANTSKIVEDKHGEEEEESEGEEMPLGLCGHA